MNYFQGDDAIAVKGLVMVWDAFMVGCADVALSRVEHAIGVGGDNHCWCKDLGDDHIEDLPSPGRTPKCKTRSLCNIQRRLFEITHLLQCDSKLTWLRRCDRVYLYEICCSDSLSPSVFSLCQHKSTALDCLMIDSLRTSKG